MRRGLLPEIAVLALHCITLHDIALRYACVSTLTVRCVTRKRGKAYGVCASGARRGGAGACVVSGRVLGGGEMTVCFLCVGGRLEGGGGGLSLDGEMAGCWVMG